MSSGIEKKLENIDNKLSRIETDTHNINRIISLQNPGVIINELKKIIGNSELKAILLYYTKEEISAKELAEKLGLDSRNLSKYTKPFLGNRGFIAELNKGREKYFQRSELVDLVGYESIPEFKEMIEKWIKENEEE